MNLYSCSNCLQVTKMLKEEPRLLNNLEVLFSDKDVTYEQAENLVNDMLGTHVVINLNTPLFKEISSHISYFANPFIVVYDESAHKILFLNELLSVIPDQVDSVLTLQRNIISSFRVEDFPSLRRLYGNKRMVQMQDYLMIIPDLNREKAFIYHAATRTLDSLYLSDSLLNTLFNERGLNKLNATKIRQYYQSDDMPYKLASFGYEQDADDSCFYTDFDLLVVNPDSDAQVISPDWYPYQLRYNPKNKTIQIAFYKWHQVPEEVHPDQATQFMDKYFQRLYGDSMMISGGELRSDIPENKTKLLLEFRKNQNKEFRFTRVLNRFELKNLKDFDGNHMNQKRYAYPYHIYDHLLYFNCSPLIYHTSIGSCFDIRQINTHINYLYDLYISKGNLYLLTRVDNSPDLYLYVIDNKTHQMVNLTVIPALHKNCEPRMNRYMISYFDLSGKLYIQPRLE